MIGHSEGKKDFGRVKKGWTKKQRKKRKQENIEKNKDGKKINGMQYEKEESFISSRHKSSELFINVLDTHFLCILNYHSIMI